MRFQCKPSVVTALNPASQWRSTAIAAALRQFIGAAGSWKKVRQASPRHKKSGRMAAFSLFSLGPRPGRTLFALLAAFAVRELLANTSRLSRAIAQVIKLCAPYIAFAFYFNARDERGISLKCSLDAFSA
jgi:hypothetical protein